MTSVAINGLGRIGRATLKIVMDSPELDLVAVNDIAPVDNLAYLLKYDTVYGRYPQEISVDGNDLVIGRKRIPVLAEKDPVQLPWKKLGVDVVFECTGLFTETGDMEKHIQAGARYAILSAPSDSEDMTTVVHGTSMIERPTIYSCASCTTNCITAVAEVIQRRIGVKKAIMTTVHAYTSTQKIIDGPSRKTRRGRAAAANLIPTTTGAAIATAKVLPELTGLFDGVAIRAPVACGSIADIVFVTERKTSAEEVNRILTEESETERYRGVLGVTCDPIVSSDILQDPHAALVDAEMTKVIDGDLVKVMAWYDNEWGYATQMVKEAVAIGRRLS